MGYILIDTNIIDTKIEIIYEIIKSTYNIEYELIEDPVLEYLIIKFVGATIFIKEKILLCLIQEFDKILFNKINNDVNYYKFFENTRVKVSQFANNVHNYIILGKKN